jgi:hypothetical protein
MAKPQALGRLSHLFSRGPRRPSLRPHYAPGGHALGARPMALFTECRCMLIFHGAILYNDREGGAFMTKEEHVAIVGMATLEHSQISREPVALEV